MDEKITVGACCDNLTVGEGTDEEGEPIPEPEPIPDLYWVAETGSNISGDGSYANPWATLAYACSQAVVPGDVIHIKAGTITETIQSVLAVGVSIIGAGNTSIIHSHISTVAAYTILLSSVEGTNGNQSISYIRMDGDALIGWSPLGITGRSNVSVHHCEFEDFFSRGVCFAGRAAFAATEPATYATGNLFYDNIVINCGDYLGTGSGGAGYGNLNIGGQSRNVDL